MGMLLIFMVSFFLLTWPVQWLKPAERLIMYGITGCQNIRSGQPPGLFSIVGSQS